MSYSTLAGLVVALIASSIVSPAAAQPVPVEVIIDGVTPGTPSGDDWCVGAAQVTVTVHAIAAQSVVTEGQLSWQFCAITNVVGGFPKEDCDDAPGPARWIGGPIDILSDSPSASITFTPVSPVMGLRLQYRPAPGGAFKRATSVSFNLDTTC